ncbi:Glutaredoxin [Kytococcus aerolatus]|uniref:Glutaredoxin n=1 Tax=Kytococcus aerolatus TaxID=592308 RepID=A0A212U0S0_9MICO|nr:glutaredoxin domain-containing protein [Kytococcus aerolatus]SNC71842.1 Glutaredoxin [Kytococcus aerolatus]
MDRWVWILQVLAGAWAVWTAVHAGHPGLAVLGAAFFGFMAWWSSPWWGGRSLTHQEAHALPADRRQVVVYWRPGCLYCARLRRELKGLRERARWVNIWQDAEAAAFVRSVNGGDEVVPTVVLDGEPHTNPDPTLVRRRLEQRGSGATGGGDAR